MARPPCARAAEFSTVSGNEWNSTSNYQPFTVREQFNSVASLTNPYEVLPGGVSPLPYSYNPPNPQFIYPASIWVMPPTSHGPYAYQFNVSAQRQLTKKFRRDADRSSRASSADLFRRAGHERRVQRPADHRRKAHGPSLRVEELLYIQQDHRRCAICRTTSPTAAPRIIVTSRSNGAGRITTRRLTQGREPILSQRNKWLDAFGYRYARQRSPTNLTGDPFLDRIARRRFRIVPGVSSLGADALFG